MTRRGGDVDAPAPPVIDGEVFEIELGDIETPPLEDDDVDLALGSDIHTIPNKDTADAVDKLLVAYLLDKDPADGT